MSYTVQVTQLDDEGAEYKLTLLDVPNSEHEDLPGIEYWTRRITLNHNGFDVQEDVEHMDVDDETRELFERFTGQLARHQIRARQED